jgi:hypothetical protein
MIFSTKFQLFFSNAFIQDLDLCSYYVSVHPVEHIDESKCEGHVSGDARGAIFCLSAHNQDIEQANC